VGDARGRRPADIGRAVADVMSTGGGELDLRERNMNRFLRIPPAPGNPRARRAAYREVFTTSYIR